MITRHRLLNANSNEKKRKRLPELKAKRLAVERMTSLDHIISVTTTTADAKLQSLDDFEINLFTLSHYLDEYGSSEFPEIGKITMNFGRQLNPVTLKRIFFTAVWFRLCYKDHNLCLKFWGNGSLHISGMKNHPEETLWLTHWIAHFFDHIESKQVSCQPREDKDRHNLLVCEHCIVWSKKTKAPIGWVPSPSLPAKHQSIGLHGKPVVAILEPKTKQVTGFMTTKGRKEYFDADGDHLASMTRLSHSSKTGFRLPVTNHPFQCYKDSFPGRLHWRISCINAKCEKSRDLHDKQWLQRDHFTKYMQRVYKDVLTSFDPLTYKAVHLTFFHRRDTHHPAALKRGGGGGATTSKRVPLFETDPIGEQIGTVGVTSTGLFWLYGFKCLDKANERAHHMVMLLKQYRSHLMHENTISASMPSLSVKLSLRQIRELKGKPLLMQPVARKHPV